MNELTLIAATLLSGMMAAESHDLSEADDCARVKRAVLVARRLIAETREVEKREQGN